MKSKIVTTALALMVTGLMAFAQSENTTDKNHSSAPISDAKMDSTHYTCSMHPDVKMDKPGKCPQCGMALEKKNMKMTGSKSEKNKTKKSYTCTMHPEMKSDKPGKCSKCGMSLVEKK